MQKTIPSEHAEQVTVVQWFDAQHKQYRGLLVASMNGAFIGGGRGRYGLVERYKQAGMRNGFPDLFLPVPVEPYHGLFIEMKRSKGGRASKEQKEWIDYLNAAGYKAEVCHGFEQAKEVITCYLNTIS